MNNLIGRIKELNRLKEGLNHLENQSIDEKFKKGIFRGNCQAVIYINADAENNDKIGLVSKYNESTKKTNYKITGGMKDISKFTDYMDLDNIVVIEIYPKKVSQYFIKTANTMLAKYTIGDLLDGKINRFTYESFVIEAIENKKRIRESFKSLYKNRIEALTHLIPDEKKRKKLDEFHVDKFNNGKRVY